MSSMMETLQIRKQVSLPVSQRPTSSTTTDDDKPAGIIRRSLSSLSLNLSNKPTEIASAGFQSVSAIGEQARSWWEWSRSWILSKKLDQSAAHITEEVV
ncbi:hypothetical protein YC2023_088146 [Brassica napus]|uniref:(rape) hypothetical protein n=1 Tax=Brassica napus TaxID=3708 RepID=A0A816NCG2_BRANA|nr:unnamed protein product [Brassica napus]